MRQFLTIFLTVLTSILGSCAYGQKQTRDLYIPIQYGKNIELNPRIDTLENGEEYVFRIRVTPDYKIAQFLFEKGLAIQNDSVLTIRANSQKKSGYDTATLRVIVTSISGTRIYPYQKEFIVKVPEKTFPMVKSKVNIVMLNDKVLLERNSSYTKDMLIDNHPFLTMYDNAATMNKIEVQQVTISLMEKEGKQYVSKGDTISGDAIHELKKIKKPTPVYIRVQGKSGRSIKTVWNRIVVYKE